jgi:hypothetical protein
MVVAATGLTKDRSSLVGLNGSSSAAAAARDCEDCPSSLGKVAMRTREREGLSQRMCVRGRWKEDERTAKGGCSGSTCFLSEDEDEDEETGVGQSLFFYRRCPPGWAGSLVLVLGGARVCVWK